MQQSSNPYESPRSDIYNESTESSSLVFVTKRIRFANLIIDYCAYLILTVLVGLAIGFSGNLELLNKLENTPDFIISIPIIGCYYLVLEYFTGRTLGKLVTGTKVVSENGQRPTIWQIISRTIIRFIPFEALTFLGNDARGVHDSWPKTYVVKSR